MGRGEFFKGLAGAAVVAALAITGAAPAAAQEKLKVGFVYVGPISDHGWTYRHDEGRLEVGVCSERDLDATRQLIGRT